MADHSSHRSWIKEKAEAARSEREGDGASDVEAFFASQEEVKLPTILAAGAGLIKSGIDSLDTKYKKI